VTGEIIKLKVQISVFVCYIFTYTSTQGYFLHKPVFEKATYIFTVHFTYSPNIKIRVLNLLIY